MSKKVEPIKGFKGFDKTMKCRDFQFENGKQYEHKGEVKHCESGFHFCEYPLDVFSYYHPSNGNVFAEVIGSGKFSKEENGDNKIAVSKIEIGAKISLNKLIKAAVEFTFKKIKWNHETISKGDYSGASSSGDYSTSEAGKGCVALAVGLESKAKGKIGSWIVLTECEKRVGITYVIDTKASPVDGKKIKEDIFYTLKNGKAVEI